MKIIKEFLLDSKVLTPQSIYLPAGTDIVDVQSNEKGLMLLAISRPDEYAVDLPELRTFKICIIDEKIYAGTVKYIGSFDSLSGKRYVVELIKGV